MVSVVLAGLLVASASACDPLESFSEVPEIAPLRVTQKDSSEIGGVRLSQVDVVISWRDGNGDLGIPPRDTTATNINYFLGIEKKKRDGSWVRIDPLVFSTRFNPGFNGRFVNLNPEGFESTKAFRLRGELLYRINSPGFVVLPAQVIGTINGVPETLRAGDVLRFQVQIKDRAGNLSNKITTQEVML